MTDSYAQMVADPFPGMDGQDYTHAVAALLGILSGQVTAEVYADACIKAREFVARRRFADATAGCEPLPIGGDAE